LHVLTCIIIFSGVKLEAGSAHLQGNSGQVSITFAAGICKIWSDNVAMLALTASSILGSTGLLPSIKSAADPVMWLLSAIDQHYTSNKSVQAAMVG
jgi:hypothetical protein